MKDQDGKLFFKAYLGERCFAIKQSSVRKIITKLLMADTDSDRPLIKGILYSDGEIIPLLRIAGDEGNLAIICDDAAVGTVAFLATKAEDFIHIADDTTADIQMDDESVTGYIRIKEEKIYLPLEGMFEGKTT